MNAPLRHLAAQPLLWVFLLALALILFLSPPANAPLPPILIAH
jgi:hypothetical protein